jgi:hypothetical protein
MIYKHIEIVKAISRRVVLPGFQSQDRVEAISISEFFLFAQFAWRLGEDAIQKSIGGCDLTAVEDYHLIRTEGNSPQFL